MFYQPASATQDTSVPITIAPVLTLADRHKFISYTKSLYAKDENYRSMPGILIHEELHPRFNPWFQHGKAQLFLAFKGERVVGRISAQIDYEHLRLHNDDMGFFGFFECDDDPQIAQRLLSVAEDWCAQQGMTHIRGPFSFSINATSGMLVEGFEYPNYIMMPHGKRYYEKFVTDAGYSGVMDLYAWRYQRREPPEHVQQIADAVAEYPGLVVRQLDMKHLDRDIRIIMDIFNEAWANNWGFVPLTEAEIVKFAREFRLVADPSLCLIAEVDGEPAAMAVAFPNIHEVFYKSRHNLLPLASIKDFIGLKRGKCRSFRQVLLGVRKKYRGSVLGGLSVLLYMKIFREAYAKGYVEAEASWTLANNEKINNGMAFMGAEPYKTYRVFEKEL